MNTPRILVVDDNATNLKLVATTLKFSGYDLSTALDAEAALKIIASSSFDLILMNIAMPGIAGLTLTRRLKTDEKTQHIPIVILTASAMWGDEQKAFDAGCNGYITKPINTRTFPRQVAAYLPKFAPPASP